MRAGLFLFLMLGGFNFLNLVGFKPRMINTGKKEVNTLRKMFVNVTFFDHVHFKVCVKVLIMNKQKYFLKILILV